MNDPQEKNTQNPYHIYYDNYLDTHCCNLPQKGKGRESYMQQTVFSFVSSDPG